MNANTETTDRRLERWIAILLSLLFLLPFIVQAANAAPLPEGTPTVSIDAVGDASLLLKTTKPGQFLEVPAVSTDVDIHVTGVVLRAHVTQQFTNPTTRCVEGIYAFPLPENSAVDTLRMTIGNRVIEGEIHEREEAKAIYEAAKDEGRKASLVEQQRPNLFTTSVASVLPGESVKIELEYQQIVAYDDGRFSLRFPMIIAPRYTPAGSTAPDTRSSVERSSSKLHVVIEAGVPIVSIRSTYATADSTAINSDRYEVTLALEDMPADKDFVLEWQPQLGSVPRSAVFTETRGGETYALFMLLPPIADVVPVRVPREAIFIIDTSGSMEGTSLDQAREALTMALDRLLPNDTFNVVEFDDDAHKLFDASRHADASSIAQAKRFVGELSSDGGTEMMPALEAAFATPESAGRVRQVIFITDGQVGNEQELFDFIAAHLGNSRLFTVGIGAAPNSHFMSGAARMGRGTFTYVGSVTEVKEKMGALFAKLENPVLTNVSLALPAGAEVWPSRVPDLYLGEPLLVTAKMSQGGRIALDGRIGPTAWTNEVNVTARGGNSGIAKLWARRKIEALMDSLSEGADATVVRHDVIDVALANHLVSQYTSLVAVDRTPAGLDSSRCTSELVPLNDSEETEEGSLPQTATPAALLVLLGGALACAAFAIRFFVR
jgi:Ca-activated chloride channel homolog